MEYEQFNKKYISNKKHGNYNNMKIGNIIKAKNLMVKGYHDKNNFFLNKKKKNSHIDNNCNSNNISNDKKNIKKNEHSNNGVIN